MFVRVMYYIRDHGENSADSTVQFFFFLKFIITASFQFDLRFAAPESGDSRWHKWRWSVRVNVKEHELESGAASEQEN